MATAVLTLTKIKQNVTVDGLRSVEATIDFDTGDYTANGLNLATVSTVANGLTHTGLLKAIGLAEVRDAYIKAAADVDAPYTQAEFVAAADTKTIAYFVDTGTNGTPQAPRLVMYVGDNVHGNSAIDASAQVRIRFDGRAF